MQLLENELATSGRIDVVDVVAVVQIESFFAADEFAQAIHFDGEREFVANERIGRLIGRRLDPQAESVGIQIGHLQVRQDQLDAITHRIRRTDG